MPSQPSNAGIVTNETGERHIPESTRPDGSTRKAIKIRPGYRPPEDVEVYKNRTAETFRNRGKGPVPGAEGLLQDDDGASGGTASNKNAKRREARKKAKASAESQGEGTPSSAGAGGGTAEKTKTTQQTAPEPPRSETAAADPEAEREKKARGLKKKLKQARELLSKKEGGETLLPEQIAKVIKINELIRELDILGFDADGEPKTGRAS